MADNATTGSNQSTAASTNTGTQGTGAPPGDLDQLLRQSPFGPLLDIPGVNASNLFANVTPPTGSSSFNNSGGTFNANSPYGGNPFAGDNFWNTFAGGVNPSRPSTTTGGGSGGGGGFPGGGGAGGGFPGGGGAGGGFPGGGGAGGGFAGGGGSNTGGGGAPANPLEGDNFWNTFAGGVNPTKFSSDNPPTQAFAGGNSGGTTPVPEPSSMIGIAVIGFGIAAGKFKQRQRAAKANHFDK